METTYTIEFMRLAEPPLAPIKRPSAFHVAYYCNLSATLLNPSGNGQIAELRPPLRQLLTVRRRQLLADSLAVGKRRGEGTLLRATFTGLQVMDAS